MTPDSPETDLTPKKGRRWLRLQIVLISIRCSQISTHLKALALMTSPPTTTTTCMETRLDLHRHRTVNGVFNMWRVCSIGAFLIALQLISSGCGQTRQIDPAVPQSGPLIGTWEYLGDDLDDVEAGVVRNFVIGDGTWYIPQMLTFKADGTSANIGYHDCHFWILDDQHIKLSVGNGNRIHDYQIKDDTLTLTLLGPYDGTRESLTFTRIER